MTDDGPIVFVYGIRMLWGVADRRREPVRTCSSATRPNFSVLKLSLYEKAIFHRAAHNTGGIAECKSRRNEILRAQSNVAKAMLNAKACPAARNAHTRSHRDSGEQEFFTVVGLATLESEQIAVCDFSHRVI